MLLDLWDYLQFNSTVLGNCWCYRRPPRAEGASSLNAALALGVGNAKRSVWVGGGTGLRSDPVLDLVSSCVCWAASAGV